MKSRILSLILAMIALALSPIAAKDKLDPPDKDQVVIVFQYSIAPAIDENFFSHYAKYEPPSYSLGRSRIEDGEITFLNGGNIQRISGDTVIALFNRKPEIELYGLRKYLAKNEFLFFTLPMMGRISVPDDSQFLYLGHFSYTIKDNFFNFSKISISDDYDEAVKAVQSDYGKGAKLVRVNLQELPAEK